MFVCSNSLTVLNVVYFEKQFADLRELVMIGLQIASYSLIKNQLASQKVLHNELVVQHFLLRPKRVIFLGKINDHMHSLH